MSRYPGSETERRIAPDRLHAAVQSIFEACDMVRADAALLSETLVAADLRGVHSHGVLRVPDYVAKLRHQGVNPTARPIVVSDQGAALVIDGQNAMGQIASFYAMAKAIDRARRVNVAAAAVRGSNHCGAMFYYAMQALPEDMIGIAMTNALPTMAPWGGKDKIVGINPLAVAIPTLDEAPIVLDAAFSYSSHGKIRIYHQKGYPIAPTWAFDSEGQPTTETAKAMEGLLQPIGEYKGVGLAIIFGLLSSMLSGAAYGTELGNMVEGAKAGQDGHFFLALRVAGFEDPQRFKERTDAAVRQIRDSRPIADGTPLYAPGGLEHELAQTYTAEGIPLNDVTWQGLEQALSALGLAQLAEA